MSAKREKTRQRIIDAFMELAYTKGIDGVYVKDICQKAGINRSTFYEYYNYLDELIEEVIIQQFDLVLSDEYKEDYQKTDTSILDFESVKHYIEAITNNQLIDVLLKSERVNRYFHMLVKHQVEVTLEGMKQDDYSYYQAYFHNVGSLSIIFEWLKNGRPVPMDSIVKIIQNYSLELYKPIQQQD